MRKLLIFVSLVLCALLIFSCSDESGQADETTVEETTVAETDEAAHATEETTAAPETTAEPETEPETEPIKTVVVKQFTFTDSDELSFNPTNHITDMRIEDGLLKLTSTGGDPFMITKDPLDIDATEIDLIRIKALNMTESYDCQLFFDTDIEGGMSEDKSYRCIYDYAYSEPDSDEWNIIEIYTEDCFKWEGLIKYIRFDPSTTTGDVFIDYISFEKFEN